MGNRAHFRLCITAVMLLSTWFVPAVAMAQTSSKAGGNFEVEVHKDIVYVEGKDVDERQKLDLYVPKGAKDCPVLFFVHGGAWTSGARTDFSAIARTFAKNGVAFVSPGYRLSPQVQHPGHIQDVAKGFAWTRANIGKYGGNAEAIFVGGHSAGGHLAALLATDDEYLKAEKLSLSKIKGAIPVSGIFNVSSRMKNVFGGDAEVGKKASPMSHARQGLPPFLIIYADNDLGDLGKQADAFALALKEKKVEATLLMGKDRNHNTIMIKVSAPDDPATQAMLQFIAKHSNLQQTPSDAVAGATSTPQTADDKDVVGTWKLSYNPGDREHEATLTVTKEKSSFKAEFVDGDRKFEVKEVKYKDGTLTVSTLTKRDGEPVTATYEGKVKGDTIEGEANWNYQDMSGSVPFQGKRQAAKPKEEKKATLDPLYKEPYVDIDEWRDMPVRHRYVHGGFKGTEARFSFYFPPKEQYQGRFFQYITPQPGSENSAQRGSGEDNKIGFSAASGGYFVETNEGGQAALRAGDPTIAGYRVNAAAANYSRVLAAQMYGVHRTYGYAWGGSGGAYRTIGGFENTEDVWDGVVPYVMGSPMAIPNVYTVRILAQRVLKDKLAGIVDAIEPGGSGDMYSGLNEEEREVLAEVTKMGFPTRGWFNHKSMGVGAFNFLYEMVIAMDPKYFEDFWTVPGYLGANPPESLQCARIQHKTTIKAVKGNGSIQVEKAPGNIEKAALFVKSGAAAGRMLPIQRVVGDTVTVGGFGGGAFDPRVVNSIKPGDDVSIENSNWLAVQYLHRHQVPSPDYNAWDLFRGSDGKPLYPQRPALIGPTFSVAASGSVQSGKFKGKMIAVESLMDQDAFPWSADWYRNKVEAHLGNRLDDNFRLWFTDHALHGEGAAIGSRTVSYYGVLYQALRDLSAWVEKGTAPPPSTNYKVEGGQVLVPPTAAERKGIQPVITLNANGGVRAEVAVGEPVTFTAVIEVPPHTGRVVAAKWDFEGAGTFPVAEKLTNSDASETRVTLKTTHSFSKSGTYFPALHAVSQRQGDAETPYARVQNLGRVRVVVK